MERRNITTTGIAVCLGAALIASTVLAQAPAQAFKPEQAVEVREGDEWSNATVVKREGRKYQIRYEDGTEEWLTADRLRPAGGGGGGGGAGAASEDEAAAGTDRPAAGAAPTPKLPPAGNFTRGAKIEVKDNARWVAATVLNRRGEWYLVEYEGWKDWREWVEPWRVRKVGSDYDIEGWHSNGRVRNNAGPPTPAPGPAPKAGEKKDPFAPRAYDKPVIEAKTDGVEDILPSGAPATLQAFDPVPPTLKLARRAYVLKAKGAASTNGPTRMLFAGNAALLSYVEGGGEPKTLGIERYDLTAGASVGATDFDVLSNPMAIAPSGKRVAGVAQGFHFGTRNRVDLFDSALPSAPPKHLVSFVPHTGDKGGTDIDWVAFVDDDRLLTFSSGGMLTLWDAPKATALWQFGGLRGSKPAMSPGGKQVAIVSSDGLHVLDAQSGKVLATVEGSRPAQSLAFTTDGKRVVGSTGAIVSQWDLAEGELAGDIGVTQGEATVAAVGPNHVLLGGSNLLDLDRKQIVWRYEQAMSVAGHGGLAWGVVRDGERTVLATAELPHPAAVKASAHLNDAALIVKPGDQVSLEVAIEGTDEQRQKIAAAITAQLKRNGIDVAPNQPVKLIARTEQGQTRSQTYERRNFGAFGPFGREVETVSVTDKITRVYFEADGKVVWENRTVSSTPWHVAAKQGQSIGEAVQAASTFNLAFLESVRVPAYVAKVSEISPTGTSRWSMSGVRDDR